MDLENAFRCFDRSYLLQSLAAAVVLVGLAIVGKPLPHGSAARIAVAIAKTLVSGYLIFTTLWHIRRLDELYQRIHLIAIVIAFGIAGVVVTGVEFLSKAGVPVPPLGLWLWLLMTLVWMVGVLLIARRYR